MIAVEPRRPEALRIGFAATDWTEGFAFEDYASALDDWTVDLLTRDQQPIGAVFTRDAEFHVSILPQWRGRWVTRGLLKKIIPTPRAITRVTPGFEHVGGYLIRLGFERQGIYYVREHHGN